MGDMADFYNEQVEEMEYERFIYRTGGMSYDEAYEKGIIDELGYEANAYTGAKQSKYKICRQCGVKNLHWQETENTGWRLFDKNNEIHNCNKKFAKGGKRIIYK